MDAPDLDFGLHIETARLQEFLAQLLRRQEQIQKSQEELAVTLADLQRKFQDREHGLEEQSQALQRLQETALSLSERHQAVERLRIGEKMEKYDSNHKELKALQTQFAQLDSTIKTQEAAMSHLEGRTMTVENKQNLVEDKFSELLRGFAALQANQTAVASQCKAVEARCSEVERLYDELSACVENKYENLWKGVEQSLEKISTAELKKYHKDIQEISTKVEKSMNVRISYCLDILARATETNRNKDLKRSILLRWREQAWLTSRRKIGLFLLANRIHGRLRSYFMRWFHQARWASEVQRVKEQCCQLIPDLTTLLAGTVNPRLKSLEEGFEVEAGKIEQLLKSDKELWEHLQVLGNRANALEVRASEDTAAIANMARELDAQSRYCRKAEEGVQHAQDTVAHLSEQLALVAREDDVKNMMKDILLIWTAVKQLDAAKADRKEVENLGVEINSRNEENHLERQLSAIQSAIKDSNGKHEELEFMFGLVVRLLEDVTNIQFARTQARRTTGLRSPSGRSTSRSACRLALSRSDGVTQAVTKLDGPLSPLKKENKATEVEGGRAVSDLRYNPATPDCKADHALAQPLHQVPGFAEKQTISSPSVTAFAEWVEGLRKTIKQEQVASGCCNRIQTHAHAGR